MRVWPSCDLWVNLPVPPDPLHWSASRTDAARLEALA